MTPEFMPDIKHCELHGKDDGQTSYVKSVANNGELALDPLVRAAAIDEASSTLKCIYEACGVPDTDKVIAEFRNQISSRRNLQHACKAITEIGEIYSK